MVSAILEGKPDKNLILVTGRVHPKLAQDVADQLGIDVLETTAYDFANGEMYVRYTESVRGADVFVLQSHYQPINKAIMEQLIMIDALKRASARSITAVCPLLGYSRQDKKHRGREPISCRLVFDLLKTAGADRIMSVDLHAAQSQGFFDGPVDHLIAMPVLVDYIRDRFQDQLDNVAVVSPDAGRIRVAEQWAQRLGGGPLAFVHKTRDITRPNQAVSNRVVGDVAGKDCFMIDDMIDTARSACIGANALKKAGAKSVSIMTVHPVFSDPAYELLKDGPFDQIVVTNSIPLDERFNNLSTIKVISLASMLAECIERITKNAPLSAVYDAYATPESLKLNS